jgi:2',3'-cyclic-nucleotide 2'-phosphodiesterase / 3'-nucleotidase
MLHQDLPRPETGAAAPGALCLRLMATTDLHRCLTAWDYLADRPAPGIGLAALAPLISDCRAAGANCLLFDNGDSLFGVPLGAAQARDMVQAMNLLGYDAVTLGNHDFDAGLPALAATLPAAQFPVVLSNLTLPGGPHGWVSTALIDRDLTDTGGAMVPLRIGVIGLVTTDPALWDPTVIGARPDLTDMKARAAELVPALRDQGADLVVALCHDGIGPDGALALAKVPGLDVVIAGHSHGVFPGPGWQMHCGIDPVHGRLHGKPAVMAGAHGSHLGVIDLILQRRDGHWAIAADRTHVLPAATSPAAPRPPALARHLRRSHDRTRAQLAAPAGVTDVPLDNHLSRIGPDALSGFIAAAKRSAAQDMLAGHPQSHLPVLVAVSPRGGQLNLPPGPVRERDVAAICPYPGALTALLATGTDILAWLDHSATAFARLIPACQDQPLFDPAVPAYRTDQIDGVSYVIDPTRGPGCGRVTDLHLAGQPVQPNDRMILITSSFRAGGGGGFAVARQMQVLMQGPLTIRDALQNWIRGHVRPVPPTSAGWRLTAPPGTAAWFDTDAAVRPRDPALTPIPGALPGRQRLRLSFAPLDRPGCASDKAAP